MGEYCNSGHQCVAKITTGTGGCTTGNQCLSGVCAGNVCCSGPCTDQGAASCGTNGTCAPGTGICQFYGNTTSCSSASCTNAISTTYTTCDGMGSCAGDVTVTNCPGNLQCDAAMSTCLGVCSQPSDCISGYTCSSGSCLRANGQSCATDSDCASNQCLGNICCGSCITGGTCGATACAAGTGACIYPAPDTVCMPGFCAGTLIGLTVCDGAGSCKNAGNIMCPTGKCTANGCSACTADVQCGPYGYCSGTTCQPRQVAGAMCTAGDQCVSNGCLANICQ
jgi:hypothetical protein